MYIYKRLNPLNFFIYLFFYILNFLSENCESATGTSKLQLYLALCKVEILTKATFSLSFLFLLFGIPPKLLKKRTIELVLLNFQVPTLHCQHNFVLNVSVACIFHHWIPNLHAKFDSLTPESLLFKRTKIKKDKNSSNYKLSF